MRMHRILAAAALGTCLLSGSAWAQNATDARLETLEKRIYQLEERLAERDAAMMEKEQALAKLKAKVAVQEQTAANIHTQAEKAVADGGIGGAIEVEIVQDSPYEGKSTSASETATVDVAIEAEISDAASAEVVLTMGDESEIEVDTAAFTIGVGDTPVSFTAGLFTLPFADFGTELISDPMGLEMGEAGESALQLSFESEAGLAASAYVFNGDVDYKEKDRIGDFGVQLDYGIELGGIAFNAGVGWINDVAEANALEGTTEDGKKAAGLAISGGLGFGPVSFTGHYMTVRDRLNGLEWNVKPDATESGSGEAAQPSAYGVEAAYALGMGDREVVFAAGWQRTREAIGLEMPESRILFGFSTELVEGVGVALEYARHNDYGASACTGREDDEGGYAPACGTGKSGSTVTLQLAAEF